MSHIKITCSQGLRRFFHRINNLPSKSQTNFIYMLRKSRKMYVEQLEKKKTTEKPSGYNKSRESQREMVLKSDS